MLHPGLTHTYELPSPPVGFELDVAAAAALPLPRYEPVSRFPPVRRDLALVVDEQVAVEQLLVTIRSSAGPLLSEVSLFDVYRGTGIGEGRKSLAFRVLLQDTEKTLTDADVEEVMAGIVGVLQKNHEAVLRS